ncbi:MAG: bifunctional diguanylate cyclase/phosphodiesterase, partial [bacterium]
FGDTLLKTLTIHLNKIPEIRDKIYRFGGDEFAFLVKNLYGEQVYEVAHKVMRIFDTPFYIDGYETACTVSLGIAFLNDTNKDPNDLIRKANLSLSDAKASGKNKFILYDISLQKFEEDTVSIERALKTAIDDGCGEFKVYFQPIIDTKTGKITAAEALVRWFSPEFGFVSPVKFIPIAEQTGLIIPLGKYILNTAVKEAKKWLDYGRDIAVSVNFSVIQTLQTDLVQTILKALQTYKLPARNLLFEITESLAINDVNKVIEILTSVRQIGVKIAMDDFGTGYSSLNHLRRMPLDYVKIDRSFIFNIEFDPYTVSFVDTIAKFCHMKGTKICCEGVENETQKNLLKSVNADSLQGYLFGKPAPAEEFWKRLIAD